MKDRGWVTNGSWGGGRCWQLKERLLEELPVLGDVMAPLAGHPELIENRVHRADSFAISAVDTSDRVNEIHFLLVGRGDAVHRTDIQARRILHPNTGLSNYERQSGTRAASGLEIKVSCLMPDGKRRQKYREA